MRKLEESSACDVLVVGGGGAGLLAAIEAAGHGASVVVACKGKAGRSGNTVVAVSQFSAVVPDDDSDDSPERHYNDTLNGGKGINDERLAWILASRGGPAVLKLEKLGVPLHRSEGRLVRQGAAGHSRIRGIHIDGTRFPATLGGLAITLPLRAEAEKRGVRFLDDAPVIRLLTRDGQVCGAVVVLLEDGKLLAIKAKAVVMAAGGAGRLYSRTNNTGGVCGDGYALMLLAGAPLKDMEFVQFYPHQMSAPIKAPLPNSVFPDGAVLRNRHGERFMHLYDPVHKELATRDTMARAIFLEVQKGNGIDGEVYADCRNLSEAVLQKKYFAITRDLRRHGIDLTRDWVRVAPSAHFFMGGAEIDEHCRTGIPGLFAAGEAAGGVHGANRISGNALTETAVFGPLAGRAAAELALSSRSRPEPDIPDLSLAAGRREEAPEGIRRQLRNAMWEGASIVRSRASLRRALATVKECASAAERYEGDGSAADIAQREETRLMCMTAEAVVLSALAREESRGAHFRDDFPLEERRWLGSHRVWRSESGLKVEFAPKAEDRHHSHEAGSGHCPA